jgi:hypothetical protein
MKNSELEVDPDAAAQIKAATVSAIRRHEPLVYGRDWDYKPIVVPPGEAQFVETLRMNATLLASVYGLPPDRVGGTRGDSLTYNTVEQSTLQVIEALRPWMVRLETAFFDLLPANRYVRFNPDALLKTDLKTRTDIYQVQRNIGLMNIDEMRDMEDLPPLPNQAGGENIPLEVVIAMARSIRGIPKSMLPGIVLEMDLAADRLEKLQKEGSAAPNVEPSANSPATVLGHILGQQRDISDLNTDDVIDILRRAAREGKNSMKKAPDFIGPWIPSDHELARMNGANGNGNGHGDH